MTVMEDAAFSTHCKWFHHLWFCQKNIFNHDGYYHPYIRYHDTMILLRTPDVYCFCAESGIIAEAAVGARAQEETVQVHHLALQGNSWWIGMFKKILRCIPSEERLYCRYRSRSRHWMYCAHWLSMARGASFYVLWLPVALLTHVLPISEALDTIIIDSV